MQVAPGKQATLHPPQLRASLPFVATHDPFGHWVLPSVHVVPQTPALQTSPGWQAIPQPAQFAASGEMQVPLQLRRPPWHWHEPPWHIWPLPHFLPHPPQFCGSVVAFTHAVPQVVCPAVQVAGGGPPDPDLAQLARASAQPRRATKIDLVMAY